MNHKPFTAIMVSETHWDRAWYVPFQVFRIRLVRLVDRVIDILDRDPDFRCFMLDGQMLPVEDYLEARPERRADLERLVRVGRLFLGPWYALADEFLVSPEALIRNLSLGMQLARDFGPIMSEGYVPDAFGHIAQLPQILQGFGIGSAVFWRGVGDEDDELGNEFWWEAPDGSRVLALHLRDGYHNAANLGYPMRWGDPSGVEFDMEVALRRLREAVDLLKPHARTPYLLLMNGIDHAEADPRVPEIIKWANQELADVQIEHGSLPEYVARIRERVDDELPSFRGEFNRGRYAVMLQGVYSTRMYLKQANDRVQTLLEAYAEPLSAWAWLLGTPYPASFLEIAWRKLLQNHPHDDICGCSVDQVHREMMTRFAEADQVGSVIARDSYRAVMRAIDRAAQPGLPFILYNPVGWSRSGTLEVSLHFDRPDGLANDFHLVDPAGRLVPCQVLEHGEQFEVEVLKGNRTHVVRVAMKVEELPSCGYRVYYALPGGRPPEIEAPVQLLPEGMENRYLRLKINVDGSLDLLDKETGRQFRQVAYFSDDEDAGDEYDYSPAPRPENVSSLGGAARVQLAQQGPLQASYDISVLLSLPLSLTGDRQGRSSERVECPITMRVTMRHDSRVLDIQAVVDNQARDHRLRLCFPTDLQADEAAADASFDVLVRPIDLPARPGWVQPPVPTKAQRHFVDVSDGRAGLAVFNRGLPEYEVRRDNGRNTIAITLLRGVDQISRADMVARPDHGGLPCPAPEAQCLGRHTFELALYPHPGDWQLVYPPAHSFHTPLYARRGDEQEGFLPGHVWPERSPVVEPSPAALKKQDLSGSLPGELSFLTLQPETLLLSAVKRSEQGDSLIARFYNPTGEAVTATLTLFCPIKRAQAVKLNEEPEAELPVEGASVTIPVAGKQVRTVALQI